MLRECPTLFQSQASILIGSLDLWICGSCDLVSEPLHSLLWLHVQGYLAEEGLVWEKLDAVDGDTQYFTHDFLPYINAELDVDATEEDLDLQRALADSVSAGPRGKEAPSRGSLPSDFLALPEDAPRGQRLSQPFQHTLRPPPPSNHKQMRLIHPNCFYGNFLF